MISFIEAQRLLGEATGSYRLLTTSGAGSTTTVVDTGLQDLYLGDDAIIPGWVRFRGGVEVGQIRRLDGAFTFSSGTLTMTRALANAPGASVDYELWMINPSEIILAIQRAVAKLYPTVHKRLVDMSLIVNNILDNSFFEEPKTVLGFDGGGDADDLVTVSDDSTIDDIFGTGGTAEWKVTAYSDGENDLGFVLNKVSWSVGFRDEQNGWVRVEFTVAHASTTGVWVTADRCWKLGEPHTGSVRQNTDDVINDPEFLLEGVRQTLLPTSHPSGTVTTDNGSDLTIGNIAAATRTLDGSIQWIRLWSDWRSDREIQEALEVVLTGHELGLIGLWIFDVGSGSTVYDLSVSQNNGAITSATWTTELPRWQQVNSPTVTIDRERTFHGRHSVKVVSGGSAGQLTQIPLINIALRAAKTITAKRWAWTSTGSQARLRLDWDGGTTFENGDYHDGSSQWQLLSVSGAIPTDATMVKLILETAASATAYWAYGWLDVGAKKDYPLPVGFETLNFLSQQAFEDTPDREYHPFADSQSPTAGRLLKLEGKGRVPVPNAPDDLIELNDKQMEYLMALSAVELYQTLQARVEGTQKADFITERDTWVLAAETLRFDRGVRSPFMSAELTRAWHVERDGQNATLVFGSG